MTWGVEILSNNPVLSQVFALLQVERYTTAAQQVASQSQQFFDALDLQTVSDLRSSFSPALGKQTPDLQYLQAILSMRLGEQQPALELLTQAKAGYTAAQQPQQAIRCYLALVQLHFRREDLQTVYCYLIDDIQSFIDSHKVNDALLQADFLQQLADLLFHMGYYPQCAEHAQQALALYNIADQPAGQFSASLRTAAAAVYRGNYTDALDHLQVTRQQMSDYALGPLAEIQWLHVQAHLAWHQRSLLDALQIAQTYTASADKEPAAKERVYARLLLANLYREMGQHRMAYSYYMEAVKTGKQIGFTSYTPQMQAQLAWLYLLEGRLPHARALVETNLTHLASREVATKSLTMPFHVIGAVLQMMDGEWQKADKLLHEALVYYKRVGNPLACCALHLYLTYNALHQYEPANVLSHLNTAFGWLAERQLTAYPDWWHPKIIAEVCVHALISNLYPELAEHILVNHLGKASVPALKLLEKTDDIELRRHAYRLRQTIAGPEANHLAHLAESPSKRILQELLARGELRAEAYSTLERELTTATYRHSPNPTIVAVFGLYIAGVGRNQIAEQLECSIENVRNYITVIYQQFDLPADQFKGRELRRQKLIKLARDRGFIH